MGHNRFGPLAERLCDQGYVDTLQQEELVRFELYDLSEDTEETKDVSTSQKNIADSLAAQLVQRFNEIQKSAIRWNMDESQ